MSYPIPFTKMHGLGNDFVVLDNRRGGIDLTPRQAVWLADRHIGVGCDQITILEASDSADYVAFVRFLNADGSEAGACGNATRCVAWLLMEESGQDRITIKTRGGLLLMTRNATDEIQIDMGQARLDWQDVPLAKVMDTLAVDIDLGNAGRYNATCCSMGNPHATIFVETLADTDVDRIGAMIETHALFPQRVNVGFAQILARNRMRLAVWERGSGRTLACGSGACGAVVAAIRRGLCDRKVVVELPLGQMTIEWLETGNVLMAGPVSLSFTGTVQLPF